MPILIALTLQYNLLAGMAFMITLALARLSILVFYLQLSPIRYFHYLVYTLITFVCVYTGAFLVVSCLLLDPAAGGPVREADNVISLFYGICNILIDVCMLLMPLLVVVPLQMSTRRKMSLLALLTAGGL
jgi:hypothetical protein